jgi:ectoine hydroxylase-related dioxygenase (phytanoyl-CoA dioxygenase family)
MINFDKHIYELETLGYTIVEKVFDQATLDALREQLKLTLEEDNKMFNGMGSKRDELAVDLSIHHPIFIRALDNDIIFDLCTRVLGNPILYSYTSTILKPKVDSLVQNIHIDSNKFIPNYISGIVMTIPLEDFNNENGATLYLPGSQNVEAAPSPETFDRYAVSTARKAGDVLFFNPRVYHRAARNNTDKIRYGLTAYATRSFFKQRFDFPRMIPKENLEGLSARMISFLGFNSRMPDSVEKYYKASEQMAYK